MDKFCSTEPFSNTLDPQALQHLLDARQSTRPRRLEGPMPSPELLAQWLASAGSAPDHGRIQPWRLLLVPPALRPRLGEVFAQALRERDPGASAEQLELASDKALRAPVLLLVVVDGQCGDPAIDLHERILSAGCAVQNLLLMATAHGLGSGLTSGKALKSGPLRRWFELSPTEHALCFISLGRVRVHKPSPPRPAPNDYIRTLTADGIRIGIHPDMTATPT